MSTFRLLRVGLMLAPLAFAATSSRAAETCAETIHDLRSLLVDPAFPLKWKETGMSDGKPLLLTILERDGALVVSFEKTDEGLWAEGVSVVCRNGNDYDIRFVNRKVHIGPAANLLVQYTVLNGGQFTLTKVNAEQLQISTPGWSGMFASIAAVKPPVSP